MAKFKWLIDSCCPRKGPKLIKGQEHNTKDFPQHVVDEWVKTKAAKLVVEKPEKEKK